MTLSRLPVRLLLALVGGGEVIADPRHVGDVVPDPGGDRVEQVGLPAEVPLRRAVTHPEIAGDPAQAHVADAVDFIRDLRQAADLATLPVGRVRYGLMLREDWMVMDDGTSARLGDHPHLTQYLLTAQHIVMQSISSPATKRNQSQRN